MKPNQPSFLAGQKCKDNPPLEEMRALSIEAHSKYEKLRELLSQTDDNHLLKLGLKRFDINTLKITDDLCAIKYELITLTDGRPAPFNISHLGPSEECEDLVFWGECAERGFDTIAYMGKFEFEKSELVELRDWIDSVLKWHQRG